MTAKLISLVAAALLVAADQGIKAWATAQLMPVGVMAVLPGIVELRYVLNDGMAFSMLAGKQGILIGVTSLMLIGVLVWLLRGDMPLLERISWTLVLGGGIGNLIDRCFRSLRVVDWISTDMYGFLGFDRFPTYNIADAAVTVSVCLLIVSYIIGEKKK